MAAAAAVAQLAAFSNVAAGAGAGGGGGNHAATTAENILDLSSKLLAQQQHQASHQTYPKKHLLRTVTPVLTLRS